MDIRQLEYYLDLDNIPDISKRFELKALIDKYPYFQTGIFLYLKCLFESDDKTFHPELQRLVTFVSDKRALFYYILNREYGSFFFRKAPKKEINKNRTDILLNAFFETMDDSAIDSKIEQTVIVPTVASSDYFSYLKMVKNQPSQATEFDPVIDSPSHSNQLKHQDIIDDFINNARENIKFDPSTIIQTQETISETDNKAEEIEEELRDDLFFTETLAKIYVKQQKYERAYEIIKRLSLNYPEKNIYFANQLSFLEKLIINKKYKG